MVPKSKQTVAKANKIENAERLVGRIVYLKGTRRTTKIKGEVKGIKVYNRSCFKGNNVSIIFDVLWDGQEKSFETNEDGFEI